MSFFLIAPSSCRSPGKAAQSGWKFAFCRNGGGMVLCPVCSAEVAAAELRTFLAFGAATHLPFRACVIFHRAFISLQCVCHSHNLRGETPLLPVRCYPPSGNNRRTKVTVVFVSVPGPKGMPPVGAQHRPALPTAGVPVGPGSIRTGCSMVFPRPAAGAQRHPPVATTGPHRCPR